MPAKSAPLNVTISGSDAGPPGSAGVLDWAMSYRVAELPGLYGPVLVPEDLVQRIWRERDFASDGLRLQDGRALRIRHPGQWNLLGGPDFRGAELEVDGLSVVGDVEVHFRAADWRAHGHDGDPAYDGVVLHVLLLPPRPGEAPARTASGRVPAALVLLPRLHHDLEEYVLDDALRRSEGTDPATWVRPWLEMPPAEREAALVGEGQQRWQQRLFWTGERLRAVGWEETCHQRLFEVLGYAANRAPLAALAWRHPWAEWSAGGRPDGPAWLAEPGLTWSRQGLRPANQPRRRLTQLEAIWDGARDWPEGLRRLGERLPGGAEVPPQVSVWRRQHGLAQWRREFADLLAKSVPPPRLDTLVTEAFLPLLAAAQERALGSLWWVWPPGDRPRAWAEVARLLGPPPGREPATHGRWQAMGALVQAARVGPMVSPARGGRD